MKRFLLFLLALLAMTSMSANGQTGRTTFAARLAHLSPQQDSTKAGYEFGFGRRVSRSSMILLDVNFYYRSQHDEAKGELVPDIRPYNFAYTLSAYPEYRIFFYTPSRRRRVVPYFGLYALVGIGGSLHQELRGSDTYTIVKKTSSLLTLGGGASLGAEFFFNRHLSLAAHTRFAQYAFQSEKQLFNLNGRNLVESVDQSHRVGLRFEPALYIRLYF